MFSNLDDESSQSAFHVYLIWSKDYRADEQLAASRSTSVSWPGNDDFGEQVRIPHYGPFSTAPHSVVFTCSLMEVIAAASGPHTMFRLFGKPYAFTAHNIENSALSRHTLDNYGTTTDDASSTALDHLLKLGCVDSICPSYYVAVA